MRCRSLIFALIFLAVPCVAGAQQITKSVFKIGFVVAFGKASSPPFEAFRAALHELGYFEGKNIIIERRYAEGRLDRMGPFVQEFIDQKVDIIIGVNNVVIRAARESTKTIPIVAISSIDPVAAGYASSFAQPGGNVTGLASLLRDISAKRIELVKDLLPKLSKIGVLWDANGPGPVVGFKEYEKAARDFKLQLHSFELRGVDHDLAPVFRAARTAGVDALVVVANPSTGQLAKQIFDLSAKHRLPSIGENRRYVDAGALMSYGPNVSDLYRRAAGFVDKILKGANPAELPIEEPKRFELAINYPIAKKIGVTIPPSLLVRVDK